MSIRRKSIQKLACSEKWSKVRGKFQEKCIFVKNETCTDIWKSDEQLKKLHSNESYLSNSQEHVQKSKKIDLNPTENRFLSNPEGRTQLGNGFESRAKEPNKGNFVVQTFIEIVPKNSKSTDDAAINTSNEQKEESDSLLSKQPNREEILSTQFNLKSRNSEELQTEGTSTDTNTQHKKSRKTSFNNKKKHQCKPSSSSVKNLVCKYEDLGAENSSTSKEIKMKSNKRLIMRKNSFIKYTNLLKGDWCFFDPFVANRGLCISHRKLSRNGDDSGISEGELSSPEHLKKCNFHLIENLRNEVNEYTKEATSPNLTNVTDLTKKLYSNLCFEGMTRRSRSKSPKSRFIAKKPMPLPRTHFSLHHYLTLSECYSGNKYNYKDSKFSKKIKVNECSKTSHSEEEWADISEEEKDGNNDSFKNIKNGKLYHPLLYRTQSRNIYDCCSPRGKQWNLNVHKAKEGNNTSDSSWETQDDDNSSICSSEHHYETINDYLKFEPAESLDYRSEVQSPVEFIRESFDFLDTHTADNSDDEDFNELPTSHTDIYPPRCNFPHADKKNRDGEYLLSPTESRNSIAESILMYQELNAFRRSFKKKTLKNILKSNTMENNTFKKLSKSNKERSTNFYVSQFPDQNPSSYESIPEQFDDQNTKPKKKKKYFTLPHLKMSNQNSQQMCNSDNKNKKNFHSMGRASRCNQYSLASYKDIITGNLNNLPPQTSAARNDKPNLCFSLGADLSVKSRVSVVSCSSCTDDYICRKHLNSYPLSSSSDESIDNNCQSKKLVDASVNKVRERTGSSGSEHSYLQISPLSKNERQRNQVSSNDQAVQSQDENIYCSSINCEDQNDSQFYCDLHNKETDEIPPNTYQTLEELAYSSEKGERKLWSDLPQIQNCGILEKISAQELKLQEAVFGVSMSEATYLRLLETCQEHFVRSSSNSEEHSLSGILSWHEWHVLFSDILPVVDVSKRFMADLEKRWEENFLSFDVTDILYEHITTHFDAYIKYCSNKLYRDRILKVLINTKPKFVDVVKCLEANFSSQGFTLHEFLTLPPQHISDLLGLIEEVYHWLPQNSTKHNLCKLTITALRKIISECVEGAQRMERMEEMLLLAHQLDFKECKAIPLISASRWLLKKGEMMHMICDLPYKRTFVKSIRWNKLPIYVFLFNDLIVITKRRSEDNYVVLDYCPKDMVHVKEIDSGDYGYQSLRPPGDNKYFLQLTLWSNHENKTVHMILRCPSESDKIRWMEALFYRVESDDTSKEHFSRKQTYPQVQCTQAYSAQQSDELCLFESDIVNVIKKLRDGWCKGERIRDGSVGWFPILHTTEINMADSKQYYAVIRHKQNYSSVSCKMPMSPK